MCPALAIRIWRFLFGELNSPGDDRWLRLAHFIAEYCA